MTKFLEAYNLPKVNKEKLESLNRPIAHREIDSVIKSLLTKKNTALEDVTG